MTDAAQVNEIIGLYRKHGWTLRLVLLTSELKRRLSADTRELFPSAAVTESDIDGLWFSRRSRTGTETWELRHISASPFALIAAIPDETAESEREKMLEGVENEMKERIIKPVQHP